MAQPGGTISATQIVLPRQGGQCLTLISEALASEVEKKSVSDRALRYQKDNASRTLDGPTPRAATTAVLFRNADIALRLLPPCAYFHRTEACWISGAVVGIANAFRPQRA